MKRILSIILLLTAIACDKESMNYGRDFDRSFDAWKEFKKSSDNSYQYTVTAGTWAGASWSTELVIIKGQITERRFTYTAFYDIRRPAGGWDEESRNKILATIKLSAAEFETKTGKKLDDVLEWTETGADLGKAVDTSAAPLRTLDQIYEIARTEWLIKRKDAQVYFEAKNSGMISSAGYVPDGCQDDCFSGISISEIKRL